MAIDPKSLPPAYQAQILKKLSEQQRREPAVNRRAPSEKRGSKYRNRPTERLTAGGDIVRFDSQKEAQRYDELMLELKAGNIRNLKLQPEFTIYEAYTTTEGKRIRATKYRADFSYEEFQYEHKGVKYWKQVVEDVKSRATKTQVYAVKKKMLREKYGIEIQEV